MNALLDILSEYTWIIDFMILCILGALGLKQRENTSSFMTLMIVLVVTGTIINYEALVKSFTSPATGQGSFVLWCIGFAVCDLLLAGLLYWQYTMHKERLKPTVVKIVVSLVTALMLYVIYLQYGPLLFGFAGPSYMLWVIAALLLGGALFDAFVIYALCQSHFVMKKPFSLLARTYAFAFFVAGVLNSVVFFELAVWETKYLQDIRAGLFSAMHISTTAVAVVITCLALFQSYNKKNRTGLLWNL